MLPIIEKELVEKNKLITNSEFIDFISVAQSFPGPIAVNIAVLIGNRLMSFAGGVLALFGVILPSFLSILFIGYFYSIFRESAIVKGFFSGVNAVVPALLAISFLSVITKLKKQYRFYALFSLSFIMVFFLKINPLLVIALGGVIGLCMNFFKCT